MYRDDSEALFARAEALQREVDELRAKLERERHAYQPPPPPPRPHTPPRDWWQILPVQVSAHVPPATDQQIAQIDERLDRIDEPVRLEDLVRRLQRLDQPALHRVSLLIDELLWSTR